MSDENKCMSMRELLDWASEGMNLQSAIDRVIEKIDAGFIQMEDLPPMPVKFIETEPGSIEELAKSWKSGNDTDTTQ